jgi:glycosyltransferase involved in cell wall biosynthesis
VQLVGGIELVLHIGRIKVKPLLVPRVPRDAQHLYAGDFIKRTGSEHGTLPLDTFHLNIEEVDPAMAIRLAGDRIGYFHIGESNRGYLGAGTINFDRIFDGRNDYERAVRSGNLWTRVQQELDQFAPNVVFVAGWSFPESVAAIGWARSVGARVVLMSASQPHDAERSMLRESVKRRVVTACDAALVAAGPHGDYAAHLGIPADRIFFGYDAVDNDYFASGADSARAQDGAMRTEHGLPPRYILASGRFIEKKNYPRLVEAFSRALATADHGHQLVILGDGPERGAIEESVRRFGVTHRVQLPGSGPTTRCPRSMGSPKDSYMSPWPSNGAS